MFKKILIANRGEIACRVIRSAKRMGIKTVAVHSEADADALHVAMADEAVAIGPAASAESYLVGERIIAACKDTGAEAVHPGYGFLSENAAFCEALQAAGVTFIGPPVRAIAAMGDKIESKKLASAAKVNTVPGHIGVIADADEAVGIAETIGFPVMIKASAGGGGKGMRIARDADEAREGFRSAQNEARSSFADDRVFIEKFIEEPRHIEIQVLADGHGNTLYLGERECSIQRRHQKVIEEAPSPIMDPDTRRAMGEQAVALARAVDYRSAGTVEFIFDQNKNFYFLEMNTRLQVEHPVTELVTGLDLVEWMIRIAAGEALDFTQEEVSLEGWAIEARLYAEDPRRNFMPSIGRLVRYKEPQGRGVRVDSGVIEGAEISMHYDPMIAKLCTYGGDRQAAVAAMVEALDGFYIRGIQHNTAFLADVLSQPRFREGRLSTDFIAETYPDGFGGREIGESTRVTLLAVAVFVRHRLAQQEFSIGGKIEDDVTGRDEPWRVVMGDQVYPVTLQPESSGYRISEPDGACFLESDWRPGESLVRGTIDGRRFTVQVDRNGAWLHLTHRGAEVEALVLSPRGAELYDLMPHKEPPDLSRYLLSPMPGLLMSLGVAVGDSVKAGQELAVVEAMKMENVLRAERDAVVAVLHANPGDSLAVDQAIIEFE